MNVATTSVRNRLGLPWWAIGLLAALAVPRVVTHDLGLVGPVVNALLVFGPLVCWVVVAVAAKVPRPVLTLVVVGAVHGVLLAIGHQVLWGHAYGGDVPQLGGNLEDLPWMAHSAITRATAFLSSVIVGTVVGVITGVVAWGAGRFRRGGT
ncbi:hypothetical protein FHX42_000176 [Saccharopolyspora lacisalsi]|uniref:Uncharacterized protein n=1 Tax=Halosaccharopolyspora lacisalsi TaxID=1000566 RepID=A0A839DTX0_9PSEU|nr:hypothetical protein [Halosaccharopolyspora lacisalsi]MBA8822847.1 hypothetical protein [Halosaccharopolyspora lacisalsi]